MNLLFLIDSLNIGGAETHLTTLATGLCQRGDTVTVASTGGFYENTLLQAGVTTVHFPTTINTADLWKCVRFLRGLNKENRFDLAHAHTRKTAFLLRLWQFADRKNAPALVVTAHAKFRPTYRFLSFWGDRTIAVSQDIKDHLVCRFGQDPAGICVIPNGIDRKIFHPAEQKQTEAGTLTVTFASRLDKDCSAAAEALICIAPRLTEIAGTMGRKLTLIILGGGTLLPTLRARAGEAQAKTEGLSVQLPGALSPAGMAAAMQNTDVFVGVSRAAMEAVLCGASVILAGNEGAAGRLTEENIDRLAAGNFCCRGEAGLSSEALLRELAEALSEPPDKRERKNRSVADRLASLNDAERMIDNTRRLYRDVLNDTEPRQR